ncbi:MAG: hypothetical protein CVU90_05830 [Firmicutes bacterium HGW-Firmicutes-15]|nr:MAG: hypothetical protein CVU90_05830 [Firmicutes bacterium HGW-Firmicutes-15]
MRKIAFLTTKAAEFPEDALKLCSELTPLVEPLENGGVFLDISGCGSSAKILSAVAHEVYQLSNSPVEIGLANSKLLAKTAIARRELPAQNKKNQIYRYIVNNEIKLIQVIHGREQKFLASISLKEFSPLAPKDARKLSRIGINTVGEIAALSSMQLQSLLGNDAYILLEQSKGIDRSPVLGLYPPGHIIYPLYFSEGCADLLIIERQIKDACRVLEAALIQRESGFSCLSMELQTETHHMRLEKKLNRLCYQAESLVHLTIGLLEGAGIREALQQCIIKLDGIALLSWREQDLFTQTSTYQKEQKDQQLQFALNNLENKFPGMLLKGQEINRREQILSLWDPWRQI